MSSLDINLSREIKRCPLFQLHRVTTDTGKSLLVKSLAFDEDGDELLKREQATFTRVTSSRIARAVGLVHVREQLGACYADFPGVPLAGTQLTDPSDIATLARELCAILDDFHSAGLLVVGLSPSSFLLADAGIVHLVDAPFAQPSGSALLRSEADWVRSPFLPYVAPEAIRPLSEPLDPSVDLYALGAVLYELLGGRPPFDSTDPAELIQAHLARQPRPLHELTPGLPRALAGAVMQLLAKTPAQRPASTAAFLRACRFTEQEPEHTELRAFEAPPVAQPNPWLKGHYGRDKTLLDLRSSLEESTQSTLTLVEGEPGSGKTSLLAELRRAPFITASCWGKFTRSDASQPLSGWTALAAGLADAALSSSPTEFELLRQRLADALGASGPTLVSLVSAWGTLLRCGPGPTEHFEGGLNRTAIALQRLLGCYADAATPMWVFLEDLQWADTSSLRILELILTLPSVPNLRIVASLRTPEPGESRQELGELLSSIQRSGIKVSQLELDGLKAADLRAWLTDSLGPGTAGIEDLQKFLLEKTGGNPFFVRELLEALARDGALRREASGWSWNGTAPNLNLPDSLLDLLILRVHQLPAQSKSLLVAAACIGYGVRRSDLCLGSGLAETTVTELMNDIVAGDLVTECTIEEEPSYAFAHDRILEAALALVSEGERAALSIRLFRLLAAQASDVGRVLTFTLANLFNIGSSMVETPAERLAGVLTNQAAGEASKARGAYAQAFHHLQNAVECLRLLPPETRWTTQAELSRVVYCQAAESALLCNRFGLTATLCEEVLSHSREGLEQVAAHELIIRALAAQKRFAEAIELALSVQRQLKIHFPRRPTMAHVIWGYLWTLRRVKALGPHRFGSLPPRRDEESNAVSRLRQAVFAITHFHKPELFPLFVYRQIEQCVTHGNDAYSSQTYSGMCIILAGLGEIDLAQQLGEVSLTLPSTLEGEKLRCRSQFAVSSFVDPWLGPARRTFSVLQRTAESALECGDFEFFGYAATMRALGRLYMGTAIADLRPDFEQTLTQLHALGQERCAHLQSLMCEAAFELGEGAANGPLSGPFYEREAGLLRCRDPMDHTLVFHHYLAQLCLAAHFGDVASANQALTSARPHVANGAFASYLLAAFLFYEAWTLGASSGERGPRQPNARRRLRQISKQLRGWAARAPANFLAKVHFVEAERKRLAGDFEAAARGYELAITEARAQSYLHEAALAHERAATLWAERGFSRLAGQHVRDAHGLYRHWGATAAAERLRTAEPQHFSLLPASTAQQALPRPTENLDYRALIKASQAISSEVLQPRLLERLLQTTMEHTAAQRGVLLLEQRGELMLVASADVDRPEPEILDKESIETTERVSRAIVRYVARMEEPVVLAEATEDATFGHDPYLQAQKCRSVLCLPISYQGKTLGLIYLENNRVGHVFNRGRLEMVSLLATQAAISIANARFHALELEAQQAKISPHFLFNALSSIAELATVDGMRAETAIVKLSHLYRYILVSSGTELVPLERELSIVRDYLGLEKLRFGTKLEFSVTHDGSVEDVRIPGLLIQPLVENSIRHAVAPKMTDGRVWVHAQVRNNRCNIVVQDDGDGIKHASSGTGFGLRSVQQRLELVYGKRYSFAISQRGGYRIELEVPCDGGG